MLNVYIGMYINNLVLIVGKILVIIFNRTKNKLLSISLRRVIYFTRLGRSSMACRQPPSQCERASMAK